MFLVPVDSPGVEYQRVETLSGELTNISFYDDVRVPDRYRIGPVNDGWAVLNGPLAEEHGTARAGNGLENLSLGRAFLPALQHALADAAAWVGPDADEVTRLRLGAVATDIEAAMGAPGATGRILGSDVVVGAPPSCATSSAYGASSRVAKRVASAMAPSSGPTATRRALVPTPAPSRCSAPSSPAMSWGCRSSTCPDARRSSVD